MNNEETITSRKLANMLELEDHYVIRHNYFTSSSMMRVTAWHRQKLLTWLLEVCEEEDQHFGSDAASTHSLTENAFGVAVNMFDRFMAREARRIDVTHLQLLGCVCLFIAAKLAAGRALSAQTLADYTDNSITAVDILEWECLVLSTLQWDVACVQPNDYLDLFAHQLALDDATLRRTRVYIALCLTEFKFAFYPASMLAAACLLVSSSSSGVDLKHTLAQTLALDIECFLGLAELVSGLVDSVVVQTSSSTPSSPSSAASSTQSSPASSGQQPLVEFEDDYDLLLNDFPPVVIIDEPSVVVVNDKKKNVKKKSSSKKQQPDRFPNQHCSYYLLTPPQPSSLPMPTF